VNVLHRHRWLTPYLLLAPGLAFLAFFFLVPTYYLGNTSLQSGDLFDGYVFTWAWENYRNAISGYDAQFTRSLEYAAIATLVAFLISYPLAYWIAFRGGRWKNLLLLLIIAPFFVTYLIRTLAWQIILTNDGFVVQTFRTLHLLDSDGHLLASSLAVVAGITYNFLPFMALPLYVSLEQIDHRLIEAAEDLYANRVKAFFRVTFPLSLPGVFAGTLLTFIPAAGDFINAQLLGTPRQYMIGNVIQSKFKVIADYPQAAALSFILMAAILVMILLYTRLIGTEKLTG
jgi:spermidine/putrescine transport system permease protein